MSAIVHPGHDRGFQHCRSRYPLHTLNGMYGVRGITHKWFSAYLSDQSQAIPINGLSSLEESLKFGVPPGSILELLLFILYTGELETIRRTYGLLSHSYVDHNQIYISCKPDQTASLSNRTTGCTKEVTNWMSSSHLNLNPAKTEFMWVAKDILLIRVPSSMRGSRLFHYAVSNCLEFTLTRSFPCRPDRQEWVPSVFTYAK